MAFKVIHGKLTRTHSTVLTAKHPLGVPYVKSPAESPIKGKYLGLCNRSACLAPGPTWWNTGSRAYYCANCACMINEDGCLRYREPQICHKVTGFGPDGEVQFDTSERKDYYDEPYEEQLKS